MTASDVQPETMPDLFYGSEERVEWDDYLTAAFCTSRYRIGEQRVNSSLDNEQFRPELEGFDLPFARPLTKLLPRIMERLEQGIVQLTHLRYFGLFNLAPTFPAECAERIFTGFNPQLATATTSPIPVEIERSGRWQDCCMVSLARVRTNALRPRIERSGTVACAVLACSEVSK